jgi:hypothetical protein
VSGRAPAIIAGPGAAVKEKPGWKKRAGARTVRAGRGSPRPPSLSHDIYDRCDFSALPVLTDLLEEAGGPEQSVLDHCRTPGEHARGCWAVDLVLGKE